MKRLSPTSLLIDGASWSSFMEVAAFPYDAQRLPVLGFDPAIRYVAAIGHLVRRLHDEDAWLREAAFRLDYGPMTLKAPAHVIDALARRIELHGIVPPVDLEFRYIESDRLTGEPIPVEAAVTLMGDDLARLLAADAAGPKIMADHQAVLADALNVWVGRNLHPDLRAEAELSTTLRAIVYEDRQLGPNARRRSPIEAPRGEEPSWKRWLGDRLPAVLRTADGGVAAPGSTDQGKKPDDPA
jgi:hypothetical protein